MSYPRRVEPWQSAPVPVPLAYVPRIAVSDAHLVFAWIATVCTLGYMLPWAIAASRRKSNSAAIGVLTFFTGWTAVGWIVALVLACLAEPIQPVQLSVVAPAYGPPAAMPPGWYNDSDGLRRYWDGLRWTNHVSQIAQP